MINKDKKRASGVVIAFGAVTAVMLYFNTQVRQGGILDDAILNKSDRYYQMDQAVRKLASQGFKTGEAVSFVIPFGGRVKKSDLVLVKQFTDKLKAAFPEFGIISLSTAANYRDTGDELMNDPYITEEMTADDYQLNVYQWSQRVKKDSGVYGLLVGRDLDYAQVIMLLPQGFDEMPTFRRIVCFLEQRQIPWWQWLFKTDIHPAGSFKKILPAGWVMGRGLTSAALLSDILKLSAIGLCLCGFVFSLSLKSRRQALIATSMVTISFIWARGSIGVLQAMGFEVYERVYILLVFTAQIVGDISFAEHKFSCYNQLRRRLQLLNRAEVWKQTKTINGVICMTAIVAVLNFLTMGPIGVRGIWEVGLISAIGILESLILVLWLLPSVHILVGGESKLAYSHGWCSFQFEKWITALISWCQRWYESEPVNVRRFEKRRMFQVTGLMVMLMVMALICVFLGGIKVRTKPLEYITGTCVYRASQFMNVPGRYGFDRISLLASASDNIYDPGFIKKVDQFQKAISSIEHVRQVNSVVDTLSVIAQQSYGTDLPQTSQQAYDDLQMIEWDLDPQVKEQLWFDHGVAVFASTAMENSNELGRVCDNIMALAKSRFPELKVKAFGKVPAYPRTDKYIRDGMPINTANSPLIIFLVCWVWIVAYNYKRRSVVYQLIGWRTGLVMSIPFVFAGSVIVLVMAAFDMPLDQATACIAALTVNAAIDFSIYMVAGYQMALTSGQSRHGALMSAYEHYGQVILTDAVLNAFCFTPLIVSSFIPVCRLGWIMVVMMATCVFGALVLMPAFFPWCIKRKE